MTNEEKQEITTLVEQAVDDAFTKRRERRNAEWTEEQRIIDEKKKSNSVTKLYLITFGSPFGLGLPEPDGRVVMHHSAYARVTADKEKGPDIQFTKTVCEIVAQGDGRLLKTPMQATLGSVLAMVEVSEQILEKRAEKASA